MTKGTKQDTKQGKLMTNNLKPDYYATSGNDLIELQYDEWGKSTAIITEATVEKYLEHYRNKNDAKYLQKAKSCLDKLVIKQRIKSPKVSGAFGD